MRAIKFFCYLIVASLLMAACQKVDYDKTATGEGIFTGNFRIQSPATASTILLNSSTPAAPVVISWTAAKPGVDKPLTYKWIAVKKGEDITKPTFELPADNDGKATTLTITQEKLDLYLFSKGVPAKGTIELSWTIQASNGETQSNSQDVNSLTVKRFSDGSTPFTLYGPEPIINTTTIDPTSTADFFQFKWQKSVPAAGSPAVKYRVVFAREDGDFSAPVFSIASDNNGSDSALKMTYQQLSDSLNKNKEDDLSKENRLKWAVQAITGDWTILSNVNNAMNFFRQVRFYIVGSINGYESVWDINNPMQVIPDKAAGRYAKVFYTYLKLKAGNEFKFFKTKGDWGSGYGIVSGSDGEYTTGFNQGGNIAITADGVYRVTLDLNANKIYIQNNQPGLIGQVQNPEWDVNNIQRGYAVTHNKFMFLANSDGNKEFKFNDGASWDANEPNQSRIFGQDDQKPAGTLTSPGQNMKATGSPVSRIIWDGTDPQALKYTIAAAHMYLIGDATKGDWDNREDNNLLPELTYQGNGIWKGTNIPLTGGKQFKFIFVKGSWDLNYGSTAPQPGPLTGSINEGGNNIGVTTTGNYTVELDEYKRTYKVY